MTPHPDWLPFVGVVSTALSARPRPTLDELTAELYRWYLNDAHDGSDDTDPPTCVEPMDLDALAALRAAHALTGTFESGWEVDSVLADHSIVARRESHQRVVDSIDAVVGRGTHRAISRAGDALSVTRRIDWHDAETSCWYSQQGEWPPAEIVHISRLYLNVRRRSMPVVIAGLTAVIDAAQVDAVLKVNLGAAAPSRADAIVLYLSPNGAQMLTDRILEHIDGVARRCPQVIRDRTPRLTLALAPGVATAQGSPSGSSFGDDIVRAVAARVIAHPQPDGLPYEMESALAGIGRTPHAPYLLGPLT